MRPTQAAVLAIAIIWAAVILACWLVFQGMDQFDKLLLILGGGAAVSIILVGGILRRR